jgi:hypothetical protein
MSEMVERVARAIADATIPIVRKNKGRDDGRIFEVVYILNGPISDDTVKIAGAFADKGEAEHFRDELERRFVGRAAIEAMREPTEGMMRAVYGPECKDEYIYRAMIDAALKD